MNKLISIAKPVIGKEEIEEVVKVLKSGELAQGKWVEQFEEEFAKVCKTRYAIAVSNGTTALHLALLSLGLKPGDEVITTPLTFMASTNAILYTGARPVFVDIDPHTFNIDPNLIEAKITSKTKAILPVHLFGLPADMNKILKIAKKHNLFILEDAAQAHGAKIGKKMVGSFGDLATFSFYPTKNMTTGEGGMVTTNKKDLANKIRRLRNHGMEKRYFHDMLGFNFRLTNIQAAIGIHQLKKLHVFNEKRIDNAQFLTHQLLKLKQIQTPYIPEHYTHVFHQYTIIVKDGRETRNKLESYLRKNNVGAMIYYSVPVHRQKFINKIYPRLSLKVTEKLSDQVLSLPIHPSVSRNELKKIADLLVNYVSRNV